MLSQVYVWRVRKLPGFLDIGVVCEHVYAPESEHADLRLMSFDVSGHDLAYDIAMVFSDSSIKVGRYHPRAATSILTKARFIDMTR